MGLRDPLPADEVTRRLAKLEGWVKAEDREEIHKTFPVEYFAAIEALGAVAEAAKELEHHPDVELHWGELTFSLTTYSAGQRIDEGAQLITALDAARTSLDTTTDSGISAGQPPPDGEVAAAPRDHRRDADALLALAEGFLQQSAPGLTSPAHTITVHIDATTLLDTPQPHPPQPGPGPGSRAEISPATGLSPTVLRRLGCDGLICLTLVCGEHHRTLHDEDIKLRRTTAGRIVALLPDGRTLAPAPPANPGTRPAEVLAEATRHVAPDAIVTRNGGPFHLDDSIRALLRDHAA